MVETSSDLSTKNGVGATLGGTTGFEGEALTTSLKVKSWEEEGLPYLATPPLKRMDRKMGASLLIEYASKEEESTSYLPACKSRCWSSNSLGDLKEMLDINDKIISFFPKD